MKIKVLIRSLVLLAGLAAWTADTAWGQASTRRSSSRGGAAAGRAAVEQRGEDDAVETVDLGDRKKDSDTASGEREGVAAAPEMPGETEKEQNGLDSLSLIPSLGGGRLDAAREAHTSTRPSARTMALLIPAPRGPILDRNGEPLAVTSVAYQLALRFEIFENPDRSRVVEFGRNCLEQAVAERLILTNPAQGCKLPQLEKREMKILPQEKIGMYLAEAERRGLLSAFYLELTTGLRRGELLALQWTDLDAKNRALAVTKQVNRINGELVVSPPKTRNSVRTLALPQQAVDLLIAEHRKHPTNPYLFPSPKTGTMYDPDAFRRTHDKILKAIGAEHIRFHDLRHPYVKHTTKIFSLRLMDFQAQAYPDARRKTRGACQLHRGGQSQSPVRPLCNRKRFS